jgi:uncharacterized protein
MRTAGNINTPWDFEAVKAVLDKHNSHFTVFGGEPLLTPIDRLEQIFEYGYRKWGQNGIQTNGSLITAAHVELFKRYNVYVGFSIDGYGELNDAREVGTLVETRAHTQRSVDNLTSLLDSQKEKVSLIITLTTVNCGNEDRLVGLVHWLYYLDTLGLKAVRLHFLESDCVGAEWLRLSEERLIKVLTFLQTCEFTSIKIDLFKDIEQTLLGWKDKLTCVWNCCDPLNTSAVVSIAADGSVSNCGRVNKSGVVWLKASDKTKLRQQILWDTSQEAGGCNGCRFFLACTGHCPGTAINGDWRNRTRDCEVLKALFVVAEARLVQRGETPLSIDPNIDTLVRGFIADKFTVSRTHTDTPHIDRFYLQVPVK